MSPVVLALVCLVGQDAAPDEWKLTPEQQQAIEEDEARNRAVSPEEEERQYYERRKQNQNQPRPQPPRRTPSQNLPQFDSAAQNRSNAESERVESEHPKASPPPQSPQAPMSFRTSRRALDIMAGLGISAPTVADTKGSAAGFAAEIAYVWIVRPWFTPRVYVGTIITGQGDCKGASPCDIGTQVGYAGGLVHLMAPIPWVGPFIELGVGMSAGSVHAVDGSIVDKTHNGVFPHARLGLGLGLGPHNEVDVGLRFIDHFTADSAAGGFMLGLRIPL